MDHVNPTRMNLLLKRGQIRLARQGADLLNRKKDALLREFYAEAAAVVSRRQTLIELLRREAVACVVAEACAGPELLASAAVATVDGFRLRLIPKNLWGVRIVDLEYSFCPSDLPARPQSPRSTPLAIDETAAGFGRIVLEMLNLAPRELRLRRIGEDIRRTNRRINALEQQLIPQMEMQTRFISQTLEERARDDVVRLKRLKTKKARTRR